VATVKVVFHSASGNTRALAEAVHAGAAEFADAELLEIHGADIEAGRFKNEEFLAKLDGADAIIFGSPTYMGMASWQFKKFADATSKQWMSGAWKDKVAGGFTISASPSGDKLSTIQYFITLAMQQGMVWVGQPSMNDGNINRIGSNSGVMAQVGPTSPAADIPQGDLDTAKAYGERVAHVAAKLRG
jgi:multimeric flavodoxin WrbA